MIHIVIMSLGQERPVAISSGIKNGLGKKSQSLEITTFPQNVKNERRKISLLKVNIIEARKTLVGTKKSFQHY